MKAIVYTKYGPPEVLHLKEVEKPTPGAKEVLIRIFASTVAIEDTGLRKSPGLNGFIKPGKPILGWYLAGEIESIGEAVTLFKTGDKVYGTTGLGLGTHAEYKCMHDESALAIKPANTSYEEAAALPNGGLTALAFLRDKGKIQKGQKVLVNGASGAVGTAAVQLASYFGAEVTGVCSSANVGLVKSLGADNVIDYTIEDFTANAKTYDIIFDAVGKSSFSQCKSSLKSKGIFLATVPSLAIFSQILLSSMLNGKKAKIAFTGLRSAAKKKKDLIILKEIVEVGKLKAVIDRSYPLEQMVEAHRYVEKGHKKGNVIIRLEP